MLYDIIMVTVIIVAGAGAIWASAQMRKAAKEGKLHVIGIVTRETYMDDSDRIDWLAANRGALKDVYWRLENEDTTIREAIDFFVRRDAPKRNSGLDQ
jgi:hypothetical protein